MGEIKLVLSTAYGWVGAKEGDSRYNEIISAFESNKKYKYDGQGCCEFVCAVFIKALGITRAKKLIPIINYAEAQSNMWKNGLSKVPQVGSVVYFATGGKKADHEELVVDIIADTLVTIDGNSNHTVVKRMRKLNEKSIVGYGVPEYEYDKEYWEFEWKNAVIESVTVKRYNTGALVLWLQKYLQAHGFYEEGRLDGVFGSYTENAVKEWQKANGLIQDGIIGKFCFTYMVK